MLRAHLLSLPLAIVLTLGASPGTHAFAAGGAAPKKAAAGRTQTKNGRRVQAASLRQRDSRGRFVASGPAALRTAGTKAPASGAALHPITGAGPAPASGVRGWLSRQLSVRSEVRTVSQEARGLAHAGEVAQAAQRITEPGVAPQGWRERRIMARAEKAVRKTTMSQLRTRSSVGDSVGVRDALAGMDRFRQSGKLGWFQRWRAARAEGKAFSRTLKAASRAGKLGELEVATEHLDLAHEMRGMADKKVARAQRTFFKNALRLAEHAAKAGDAQSAWYGLQMAAKTEGVGGRMFNEAKADKIMNKAFANAVPRLIEGAARVYKAGRPEGGISAPDRAASMLLEAHAIQEEQGIKLGSRAARKQARLVQRLQPRMSAILEQQAAQAEASPEGMPAQPAQQAKSGPSQAKMMAAQNGMIPFNAL